MKKEQLKKEPTKEVNSRIGKEPIVLPTGVSVVLKDSTVEVKGPKGSLSRETYGRIALKQEGQNILVSCISVEHTSAYWGLYRTLLANMVKGVSEGFSKTLEIQGTGYRAVLAGKLLNLTLGFSHPVQVDPPAGISFEVEKSGVGLIISGINNELVGQMAAKIIALRPAEPYQGKGIRYKGQVIRRKVGKSAGKK